MRIIVTGGRHSEDHKLVSNFLDALLKELPGGADNLTVIQGGATGVDRFARHWCMANGVTFLNYPYPSGMGRTGGSVRNLQMLLEGKPDITVAFPGRRGTANMVRQSRERGVPVIMVSTGGSFEKLEPYSTAESV
jgi:hypothetical protein